MPCKTVAVALSYQILVGYGKVDAVWADGDFNDDGIVALEDFLLLSENYGKRLEN